MPQIFAKETVTASKSAINEQPFAPTVVRPTQVLADIRLDEAPFLLGYVVTRPKPTAEVILATEAGDPLLAWWRYGLGMSVAFTSDAKARWAAEWLSWPQFGQFWAQVVRHSLRKSETKGTVVQVDRHGRKAVVSLDAIEPSGKFLNRPPTELTLVDPQLTTRKLEMVQVAPGRYQAEIDTTRAGSYQLMFAQTKDSQVLGRQSPRPGRGISRRAAAPAGKHRPVALDRQCVGRTSSTSNRNRYSIPPTERRPAPCRSGRIWRRPRPCCLCSMWHCAGSICRWFFPGGGGCRFPCVPFDRTIVVSLLAFGFAVQIGIFRPSGSTRGANAMSDRILEKLEPVRRRQWKLEIVRFWRDGAIGRLAPGFGPGSLALASDRPRRYEHSRDRPLGAGDLQRPGRSSERSSL